MAKPSLDVSVDQSNAFPVVLVRGELDVATIETFNAATRRAGELGSAFVIVSFLESPYCDSTSIQALLRFRKQLDTRRQALMLVVGSRGSPRRVFEVSGVTKLIPTFTSVEQAMCTARALGGSQL